MTPTTDAALLLIAEARAEFWRMVANDLASDGPRTLAALRSMAAGDVGGLVGYGQPSARWDQLAMWRDAGPVQLAELQDFIVDLEVPA